MLMESVLLMAIEVLKNDFLCTTFGLIFIGSNMVFTGFFRKVEASPPWINWMCYVFPFRVRYYLYTVHVAFFPFFSSGNCPMHLHCSGLSMDLCTKSTTAKHLPYLELRQL
jgi:hypothetical protein